MSMVDGKMRNRTYSLVVPLVRPFVNFLVGVVIFILPTALIFTLVLLWMMFIPESNALNVWLESARIGEWLVVVFIILFLIPYILYRFLYPSLARKLSYGMLSVDSTGLSIETEREKNAIFWDAPVRAVRWGFTNLGGFDYFISYFEVWELTQDETRVQLSRAVTYLKWRSLPQPPDSKRGDVGLVVAPKVFKAIQRYGNINPQDISG
ncbi:MAG: hypothetical protein GTO18_16900 [Anaerolineales bacterium]|nr:hypothetical protein [Anaerolineales bacterium]